MTYYSTRWDGPRYFYGVPRILDIQTEWVDRRLHNVWSNKVHDELRKVMKGGHLVIEIDFKHNKIRFLSFLVSRQSDNGREYVIWERIRHQ